MRNKTFAIIKPDAVKNNSTGKIYNHILESGFKILSAKLIKMSKNQAEQFYLVHKDRPFYNELTDFMSSGRCMVLALEKKNAVEETINYVKKNGGTINISSGIVGFWVLLIIFFILNKSSFGSNGFPK